jgi:hypothetical protein
MATASKAAGIMDLPENEDMNQAPQLSPMESYDAVTTALGQASPDAAAQYEQTMNMSLPPELLNMSAEQISQLLQLFQYLQDNPEEYATAIADLIKEGILDEGDLPAEYNEEVIATICALLMQALKTKQGGMPQQPQGFAMGGIADAARMVANQGRSGDTMLAHITPEEAQLLRSRGGMGTVNPVTGLREYGWFSKLVKGVGNVVKAVVKPIVNVAKEIVKSPIGRIVATVALTAALGPICLSYGATSALASAGITALSGGNLKDMLISSATAYFGAPGSPVGDFVGKLGITSVGAQAAAASGLVGAGASLLQGKSLKDSVKAGITQAAIGAGTTIARNYLSQPPGTRSLDAAVKNVFKPEDVFGDQIGGKQYEPKPLRPEDVAAGKPAPGPGDFAEAAAGQQPAPTPPAPAPMSVPGGPPQSLSGIGSPGAPAPVMTAAQLGQQTRQGIGGTYQTPGMLESAKTMGSGIMDIAQGDFSKGYDQLAQGASDLFMPSGPTTEQIQAGKLQAYKNALVQGEQAGLKGDALTNYAAEAMKTYTAPEPGMLRTYGPAVAAGIGAIGLAGGFKPPKPPPSKMKEDMYGTPGLDLINADPRKYIVQNLPGIEYTPEGNIAGSQSWAPSQTMADIRVNPATTAGTNLRGTIYTPPVYAPTAAGGAPIQQPFNTASMYNFMPRYAANGGMMGGGIAALSQGGYPRMNGAINGPGTEKSDSIPAMLSDGEFVMTAKAVRGAGNGSRRAGAKKMYALMHQLEQNAARG